MSAPSEESQKRESEINEPGGTEYAEVAERVVELEP
jgi:hypothetical protein